MKRILTILLAILSAGIAWAGQPQAQRAISPSRGLTRCGSETFSGSKTLKVSPLVDGPLTADFTVKGNDALEPVAVENFNSGKGTWRWDPTANVTWSVRKMTGSKAFDSVDAGDAGSLYVDGPFQIFKREKSSAYSPEFDIPKNARLSFYVGFSLNNDDYCRLEIAARTANDSIVIWNSKDAPGDKPWSWRQVTLDLGQFAGRKVWFQLTYTWGAGDEIFKTGGYMGDFAIDNFSIAAPKEVERVEVTTGEKVALVANCQGEPTEWLWEMPGAIPATSTDMNPEFHYTRDGEYAVTLTVKDGEGHTASRTRDRFVKVTGTEPVASIVPPATFRNADNHKPMVAPLLPVTFHDGSAGFPDTWHWSFTGTDPDHETLTESSEENPEVAYSFLHDQFATLEVSNSHGKSSASTELSVEYDGLVNNILATDNLSTFDMEDWGVFPGSNTSKITAYAERFSKPSRPSVVNGVYVFFNEATATELTDQIANVGVHLYTSKDGKPDKCLDSMWWQVTDLDISKSAGSIVGTAFPFTAAPVVDDEFFIVIDGIPEFSESCKVSFAMADFRDHDNTALILKDGKWMEVPEYFGATRCTSFMVKASLIHSVISPIPVDAPREVTVAKEAGVVEYPIFSIMGRKEPVESDADWLRVTGKANGLTLDTLRITYDAIPQGLEKRTGSLTVTDGVDSLKITVTQNGLLSGVEIVAAEDEKAEIFTAAGIRVAVIPGGKDDIDRALADMAPGLYIIRQGNSSRKHLRP